MSDATSERIAELEKRIEELQNEHAELRTQLAKAQLDQWEARIDDLEVQLHLGAMEAEERLNPLVKALRNRWLDAREQFDGRSTAAGDVLDSLRAGLEQAMRDIRDAVVEARDRATGTT